MQRVEAVVAGHICLDVIPGLSHLPPGTFGDYLQPGHTLLVGPAVFCTGGPVSNTGLALHRLGIGTRLIGKVGADPFAEIVRSVVSRYDPALVEGLVTDAAESTSYTVVMTAPGVDRIFLHCTGANDAFGSEDIDYDLVAQARLFHFGYPPVMRKIYADGGKELVDVFRKAKATGVTTSLDLTAPDPASPGGKVDWLGIFERTLPYVDVFLPSFEELLYCLRRKDFDDLTCKTRGCLLDAATPELISDLGQQIIDMGTKIAVIKLGDRGLYVRTASAEVLAQMGRAQVADLARWGGIELRSACFQVNVVGTTGSGDTTIAGFLSGLLRGLSPEETTAAAVAVGACNVEAQDALSGLRSWEDTLARVAAGWPHLSLAFSAPGWQVVQDGLWIKRLG